MLVLGIETSCDETGIALYDAARGGLLAHAVHSQVAMHAAYGGVVPELASRDHLRRLVPLCDKVFAAARRRREELAAVAFTEGPGLAGALLVGAAFAHGLAFTLGVPALGIHHLEGHLVSPLLSRDPPAYPFVALLVSGGHTQLMRADGIGRYSLLGETQDDAAGEAFDKTAKLLGIGYPGGAALSELARQGRRGKFKLPRPMIASGDLEFSFSGLKTAVLTLVRNTEPDAAFKPDMARAFEDAIVDVLVAKCSAAMEKTGLARLVVAGGVGANRPLRERLREAGATRGFTLYFPEPELCTDNGAMIAFAAALRLAQQPAPRTQTFSVKPRWELATA